MSALGGTETVPDFLAWEPLACCALAFVGNKYCSERCSRESSFAVRTASPGPGFRSDLLLQFCSSANHLRPHVSPLVSVVVPQMGLYSEKIKNSAVNHRNYSHDGTVTRWELGYRNGFHFPNGGLIP